VFRVFKIIGLVAIYISTLSCASSRNIKESGEGFLGGGYLVEPISEGVYKITAKTNFAQWTDFGTARRMWKKQAQEVCKGKPYVEEGVREYSYDHLPRYLWNRYIVTVKEGIVKCTDGE
jgi:hypothetical protein